MSENERKGAAAPETLPELESRCRKCEGRGRHGSDGQCGLCGGSGYELTEFGQKVLALMRHRFRPLFRELVSGE
jgi:hypothetical protein